MPTTKPPRSQDNKGKSDSFTNLSSNTNTSDQQKLFPKTETKKTITQAQGDKKGSTRITIKYDVGFANALYIRGKGANLSWDRGVQLKNTKPDEWVWETDSTFNKGEFKVLINDKHYENGENHTLTPGTNVTYTPKF